MRGKWALIGVSAVLLAVAAGALSQLRRAASPKKAEAAKVEPAAAPEANLSGTVKARNVVPVSALIDGTVEAILVEAGQDVYEGQVLARISNQGLETTHELAQQSLETAQNRVNKADAAIVAARLEASRARADASRARAEFDRLEKAYRRQSVLVREGATPRLTFERAQKDYESANAEFQAVDETARQAEDRVNAALQEAAAARKALEAKNKELEEATLDMAEGEVHAPVTGLLTAVKGEAGKQVGPDPDTRVLFQIATDLSFLEVELEPDPPTLKRIQPGQEALVFIADVQEGIAGKVTSVDLGKVLVEFASPSTDIKPGVTAQVRIRLTPPTPVQ